MPANYVLLERIELNASAASVVFDNIPQTGYTDLKIVCSTRNSAAGQDGGAIRITFNSSATNYSGRWLRGSGSSVVSSTSSSTHIDVSMNTALPSSGNTANTFSNVEVYIPNYTSSSYKSVSADAVGENNTTAAYLGLTAGLWSDTAAITKITLVGNSDNFVQYSTFSLYGLAAVGTTPVIAPKASGGNITTDGTYWIHTFNASGTFTPATALTCDYLVVAGGGGGGTGGGNFSGGGGGAGGFRTGTGLSALAQAYSITVGAGGAGATASAGIGTQGSNSVFSTITSTGGGYGGKGDDSATSTVGGNGGSGGGGGGRGSKAGGSGNQGSYSPVEGYAGGTSFAGNTASTGAGGGGGGSSAVGGNATGSVSGGDAGAGGAGTSNSYSGSAVTYAGGGGGGGKNTGNSGGSGGGGAGRSSTSNLAGGNGTTNLGGGGGGAGTSPYNGGSGGSGVVIIRYTIA